MKDAPTCEKCGTTFPWNQLHLRWKHNCTGSAESGENVAKTTPSAAKRITLPRCTQPRGTESITNRRSESDTQQAATDEDAPKCEKCGQTFPWNQLHLRWKHKCEPTEAETPNPMHPLRRSKSSASNLRRQWQ